MAFDDGLAQRVREHLAGAGEVAEKRMFGGLSFMVDGNLCVGVMGEELIARVGPDDRLAPELAGGRPFDFTGRPMNNWKIVGQDAVSSEDALDGWIGAALTFVRSLPPK